MKNQDFKSQYETFYQQKAAPLVADFNANRQKYLKEAIAQRIIIALLFYFLLSVLLLLIIKRLPLEENLKNVLMTAIGFGLFVVPCVGLIIIRYLCPGKTDFTDCDAEKYLKNNLMPQLLQIFGNFVWKKKGLSLVYNFNDLRKTKIIPQNVTAVGDDCISGSYKNVNLKITEINIGLNAILLILIMAIFLLPVLSAVIGIICVPFVLVAMISHSAIVTVISVISLFLLLLCLAVKFLYRIIKYFWEFGRFKGVMIELDMPKSFLGHTFIYENALSAQALRNADKNGYQKILLEDVDFSKRYTIYSTNQTQARYILTPAFMERLKNISFAFNAKYLRMSFQNNKMILLAATNKDLFMMASPFKDSDKKTFDTLFDEIYSVLCLIDELKLNQRI